MIIDTHVNEICTLCGDDNTSGSLLVLRLEICIVEFLWHNIPSSSFAWLYWSFRPGIGIQIRI